MPKPKEALVFETIGEIYTTEGIEGEGLTSVVYRVRDSQRGVFALKCLRSEQATTERTKRFLNELEFCRTSVHDNVVRVVDSGFVTRDGRKCAFYVMPLFGSTLRKLVELSIPRDKVLRYFSNLLDGVEAAHLRNVWHRDLKPANVLHDPASDKLVVSDFGIAHFIPESIYTSVETATGDRLMNAHYAAPEQRTPGGKVDHRADIYALGLMLNEMFTGQVPHGAGFRTIADASPEHAYLDAIVDRMRQHSPEKRFSSIDEIKLELLARKDDFVSRQRLDTLRRTVVPATTVTHHMLEHPPTVEGLDVHGTTLMIYLNQVVEPGWITTFNEMPVYNGINGSLPENWRFARDGNRSYASVNLPAHYLQPATAQQIIDNFKSYVGLTNDRFRTNLEQKAKRKEEEVKRVLKEQIAAEEKRQQILSKLKV